MLDSTGRSGTERWGCFVFALFKGDKVLAEGAAGRMLEAIHTLSPREERIVLSRFGLPNDRPLSLEEIAKSEGVGRERARQILLGYCGLSGMNRGAITLLVIALN